MKQHKTQTRKVMFASAAEHLLAASIDYPVDIEPAQAVIIAHCFTCNRQTLTTARLGRGLAQAGFMVLRLDFTGLGESGGDFSSSHFSSMVADIECAADFLASHHQPAQILVGHSMGGTACLAASQNGSVALSRLKCLVTLASPAYPAHVLHHFGAALPVLEQGQAADIQVAGKNFLINPEFIADVRAYNMGRQMQNCGLSILAVRAGRDKLIEPEDAEEIVAFAPEVSKLFQLDAADHLFSDRQQAALLLAEVLSWCTGRFMFSGDDIC